MAEVIHMDGDIQREVDEILSWYSWDEYEAPRKDVTKEEALEFLEVAREWVESGKHGKLFIAEIGFKK